MRSRIRVVFLKELRETFRDRRVILGVIVSPLLVTPLLMLMMGGMFHQKNLSSQAEVLRVGVVGESALPGLRAALAEATTLQVEPVASADEAEAGVRDQRLRAVLTIPSDVSATLATGGSAKLDIVFDKSNEKSRAARDRLDGIVRKLKDAEVVRRLDARGLNATVLSPLGTNDRNVASPSKQTGSILGIVLPYILLLSAAFGGMTSAFDLCAGEKERGTLETLLVSPASRHEIILGKLGTISVVSIVSAFCSIAGLAFAFIGGTFLSGGIGSGAISLSYASIVVMLLVVIPLALTTSSLLLIVSTFARSQKEAQAYVFPFMILILLPALFSFVLGPENGIGLALVPILNTALAMKQVLSSIYNLPFLGVALISSAFYAALAMRLVVGMFQRESVLFRT